MLADNRIALDAGWNMDMLVLELQALRTDGFDLSLAGFTLDEIGALTKPTDERDPDDAPPLGHVRCAVGEVWALGPHRLIVGDATDPLVLEEVLGSAQAHMIWTDPPYNVAYSGKAGTILNDAMANVDFGAFLEASFRAMHQWLQPGGAVYVAHADTGGLQFRVAFELAGFKLSGCIVWRKDALVLGRSDYQWQHEPILYGWKPGARHRWYGGRKQTTVMDLGEGSPFQRMEDGRWQVTLGDRVLIIDGAAVVEELVPSVMREPRPKRSEYHPTMKPVALVERMLRHNARAGDTVLDPFGGSGSTLIAADRLGMRARLVELDPAYATVIVERWERWSGLSAEVVRG